MLKAGVREAGIKNGTFTNPEEINRVVTDRLSTFLMCCTKYDLECLQNEGMEKNAYFVGDLMYDAFVYYSEKIKRDSYCAEVVDINGKNIKVPKRFYYLTCHREENTRTKRPLTEILLAMNELHYKTVYTVHPRNKKIVCELNRQYNFENILFCEPVSYLTSLYLVKNAEKVVTDSGGLQREAFFAKTQCVTIADDVAWRDTMIGNRNQLTKPNKEEILRKLSVDQIIEEDVKPFGDGNAANKIIEIINYIDKNRIIYKDGR